MGVFAGPDIVESGLVLALDAGNTKSYDKYENLLPNSVITTSNWSVNVSTVTNSATTAPDGTNTAARIQVDTASGYVAILNNSVTAGQPYTFSLWVKSFSGSSGTWGINIYDHGGVGSHNRINVNITGEWQRVSYTYTPVGTLINVYVSDDRDANATISDGYVWGAQLERASIVNDYYPTAGSAKTRGTTWTDLSGRGNNGTLTNGPTYSNGAIVFDGVDDYIDCGTSNSLNFTNSFSVSFWMNNSISTTTLEYFVNRWTYSTGNFRQWSFDSGGVVNRISFRISGNGTDGGTTIISSTNASYSVGWHHICGTWNGSVMSLYIDNLLVAGPTSMTSMVSTAGQKTFIGGGNLGSTLPMSGNISQVSIYNRALTASEIQQNYNATKSRFGL